MRENASRLDLQIFSCRTDDFREALASPETPSASLKSMSNYGSTEIEGSEPNAQVDLVHLNLLQMVYVS